MLNMGGLEDIEKPSSSRVRKTPDHSLFSNDARSHQTHRFGFMKEGSQATLKLRQKNWQQIWGRSILYFVVKVRWKIWYHDSMDVYDNLNCHSSLVGTKTPGWWNWPRGKIRGFRAEGIHGDLDQGQTSSCPFSKTGIDVWSNGKNSTTWSPADHLGWPMLLQLTIFHKIQKLSLPVDGRTGYCEKSFGTTFVSPSQEMRGFICKININFTKKRMKELNLATAEEALQAKKK